MNRTEFIAALEKQLLRLPKAARDDILNDFEAHFARGLEEGRDEEAISAELGDPAELAQTYLDNLPEGSKGAPYIQPEEAEDPEAEEPVPEKAAEPAADAQTASAPQDSAPNDNPAYTYAQPQYTYAQPGQQYAYQQPYVYTVPAGAAAPAAKKDNSGEIIAVVLLSIFAAMPIFGSIVGAWFGLIGLVAAFVSGAIALFVAGGAATAGSVVGGLGLIFIGAALICLAVLCVLGMIAAAKGIVWLVKWYIGICKKIINGGAI